MAFWSNLVFSYFLLIGSCCPSCHHPTAASCWRRCAGAGDASCACAVRLAAVKQQQQQWDQQLGLLALQATDQHAQQHGNASGTVSGIYILAITTSCGEGGILLTKIRNWEEFRGRNGGKKGSEEKGKGKRKGSRCKIDRKYPFLFPCLI